MLKGKNLTRKPRRTNHVRRRRVKNPIEEGNLKGRRASTTWRIVTRVLRIFSNNTTIEKLQGTNRGDRCLSPTRHST